MFTFLKRLISKKTNKYMIKKYYIKKDLDKKLKGFFKFFGSMLINIIKIIPSIAAVAASIATCFTVIEMRNERNQLYKPQMIFESSYFSDDYKKNVLNMEDVRNLVRNMDDEDKFPILETVIYNLGSGAALDFEINFILDNYEKYIEEITQYYRDADIEINDNNFKVSFDGMIFRDSASYDDFTIKKPFLLSGDSINVAIPSEFCKLLYCLNVCTNGDYGWDPAIHLQISYSDLQGIVYTNDYELLINMQNSYSELGERYLHVDYSIEQEYYDTENELLEEQDDDYL